MKQKSSNERAKWQERVAAWEASGKVAKYWCLEHDVPYISFITWRKRLKRESMSKPSPLGSPFIELTESPTTHSGIQISFRNLTCTLSKDFNEAAVLRFLRTLGRI